MSDGLNTQFMHDPVNFLGAAIWSIEGTALDGQQRLRYTLDDFSIGDFDLVKSALGNNSVRIRNYSEAGFFDKGWGENAIKAYYLTSRTDGNIKGYIFNKADYFFTDTLTGCTFMAYGQNRLALNVEHCNAFTNGPASLGPHEAAIANQNNPFLITYNAANYRAGGLAVGETGNLVVATVFGIRLADGWHFYACRRINNLTPLTPRLLGAGAVEI